MFAAALWLGNPSIAAAAPTYYPSTSDLAELYETTKGELLDGLGRGPSLEAIEGQFRRLTTLKDPCEADIVSVALQRPNGFGSRINTLVADALFALYGGHTLSFCVHNGSYGGWYPDHFDSAIPMCTDPDVCGYFPQDGGHNTPMWIMSYTVRYCLELARPSYANAMLYHIYAQAFNLGADTLELVWTELRSIGLSEGEEYIGVHIRHGDKDLEAHLVPTEEYGARITGGLRLHQAAMAPLASRASFLATKAESASRARIRTLAQAIKGAARERRIKKVFLASDDADAFDELQVVLGSAYTLVRQPPFPEEVYADRTYQSEDAIMGTLADIVGLWKSTVFIGTASSTFGQVVRLLRRDTNLISLDSEGRWGRAGYCRDFLDRFFILDPTQNNSHGYVIP